MGVCNPDAVGGADGGFLGLLGFQGKRGGEWYNRSPSVLYCRLYVCITHKYDTTLPPSLPLSLSFSLFFTHTHTHKLSVFSHASRREIHQKRNKMC